MKWKNLPLKLQSRDPIEEGMRHPILQGQLLSQPNSPHIRDIITSPAQLHPGGSKATSSDSEVVGLPTNHSKHIIP